jgi:hypothetical protein
LSIISRNGDFTAAYVNQEDFWARASSKEKLGMALSCWHISLENKHGNLGYWDDMGGTLAFESSPVPSEQAVSASKHRPAKIIIYIEFVSMMYLLQSVS